MVSEEQKNDPNYRWEWEGKSFKYCPKCKKAILAEWTSHNCGWGKTEQLIQPKATTENADLLSTTIVSESLKEAKDIYNNNFTSEYPNESSIIAIADQIRRTKLSLMIPKK